MILQIFVRFLFIVLCILNLSSQEPLHYDVFVFSVVIGIAAFTYHFSGLDDFLVVSLVGNASTNFRYYRKLM